MMKMISQPFSNNVIYVQNKLVFSIKFYTKLYITKNGITTIKLLIRYHVCVMCKNREYE